MNDDRKFLSQSEVYTKTIILQSVFTMNYDGCRIDNKLTEIIKKK